MDKKLIDLALHIHIKTAKAILVSDDGDKEVAVWLPLSQIEMQPTNKNDICEVTVPEWLAKEKGLI